MTQVPASSHGGGPASGSYLPSAKSGTLDTTTYNDPLGSGKLAVNVFPLNADDAALAWAQSGDAFPRAVFSSDPSDYFLYLGDGTVDPVAHGGRFASDVSGGRYGLAFADYIRLLASAASSDQVPRMDQVSPKFTVTSGALNTLALVSGAAAQIVTTRDVETHTPVTFNPGVATTATCTVALSPDNVTYSTLAVVTKPVGTVFDGEIDDIVVRVPAGWYLKLTVVNATIGTTTYY